MNKQLPTPYFRFYHSAIAAPVVMRTVDPGIVARKGTGSTCCKIVGLAPGNIVVRPIGGASNGSDDITLVIPAAMTAPVEFETPVDQITSSTATDILVYWPRLLGEI